MKIVDEFNEKYNLTVNGKYAYGTMNGFQIWHHLENGIDYAVTGGFMVYLVGKKQELNQYLVDNKKQLKYFDYRLTDNGVFFMMRAIEGVKGLFKLLELVGEFLSTLDLDPNVCPVCGKEMIEKELAFSDFELGYICKDCLEESKKQQEEEQKAFDESPNNYGVGFLGALGGAIVGSIVWVIVALIGYVTSIVAILITFLAGVGYDLLKGKKNTTKLFIVAGASFLTIIIAEIVLYSMLMGFGEFMGALFTDTEVLVYFGVDLLQALLFGAVGIIYYVFTMKKDVRK